MKVTTIQGGGIRFEAECNDERELLARLSGLVSGEYNPRPAPDSLLIVSQNKVHENV